MCVFISVANPDPVESGTFHGSTSGIICFESGSDKNEEEKNRYIVKMVFLFSLNCIAIVDRLFF